MVKREFFWTIPARTNWNVVLLSNNIITHSYYKSHACFSKVISADLLFISLWVLTLTQFLIVSHKCRFCFSSIKQTPTCKENTIVKRSWEDAACHWSTFYTYITKWLHLWDLHALPDWAWRMHLSLDWIYIDLNGIYWIWSIFGKGLGFLGSRDLVP